MGRPQRRRRPDLRRLAPRPAHLPGRGGRRETASARRMCCRGTAGCRPGPTDHGERGKRPARAGPLVAARQGPMPADGRGAWRSPRSSPRAGKPSAWLRRPAGPLTCHLDRVGVPQLARGEASAHAGPGGGAPELGTCTAGGPRASARAAVDDAEQRTDWQRYARGRSVLRPSCGTFRGLQKRQRGHAGRTPAAQDSINLCSP
jgi:hypothetical protein